jgi:deoxyribodipyrimidine photo-lyase
LAEFLERVDAYDEERDRIDLDSTSHLSVDLKYGWVGARRLITEVGTSSPGRRAFVRQVAWRDFYGHLMAAKPDMATRVIDRRFETMAWRNDADEIEAWKTGQTGFPTVDAAMRRLVAEGQMHNRARLVAASFLVKDLLVDWRIGERFFRHHLIDGDIAQNAGTWQWVAGTGTDAAPYFRVFNPVTQSKRFDPEGRHLRRWIPELGGVPNDMVHSPWESGPLELIGHGVELGLDYPEPIVDHAMARQRAITAYETARGSL